MIRVSLERAEAWAAVLFEAGGALSHVAASVAKALVGAEADGLKGHGLSRLPTYLAMLRVGKIDGQAIPFATRPRPGVLAVDAAGGFAYPALDLVLAELPAMARAQGVAVAPIRRSNHCGAAGLPVERLAEQGLVALIFANTPQAMAPWGGSRPVFGTNPLAFAAPLPGRPPVVVDLALSTVARSALVAARQKGESIPEGWAFGPDGRPTTDPAIGLQGTMAPLGGAKGASLAFMVEVLAAALVGAHFGFEASSFMDDKGGPPLTGQLVLVIDPGAMDVSDFGERMSTLAAAIESQEGARLSGTRRLELREAARSDGIDVAADLIAAYGAP